MSQDSDALRRDADALLRLLSRAERLEALPRTGWLVCGVQGAESVAAHTCMVALVALWIADHHDEPVDRAKLLHMALLHDLGEAMLTDLPWPVKRFVGEQALKEAEQRAGHAILADAPASWRAAFDACQDMTSLEARILKAADRLQLLAKALQYERQQRGDVARFWQPQAHREDFGLPQVAALFERLLEHHAQGTWYASDLD